MHFNPDMTHRFEKRPLTNIGDALAYGRADMDRVMREILSTEGVRPYNTHYFA